jgi:hypothetical protein
MPTLSSSTGILTPIVFFIKYITKYVKIKEKSAITETPFH